MKQTISLTKYLQLGGKIENLDLAYNRYHTQSGPITFSHTKPPSYGNPNGVNMYKVGEKTVAEMWIQVEVTFLLAPEYL